MKTAKIVILLVTICLSGYFVRTASACTVWGKENCTQTCVRWNKKLECIKLRETNCVLVCKDFDVDTSGPTPHVPYSGKSKTTPYCAHVLFGLRFCPSPADAAGR